MMELEMLKKSLERSLNILEMTENPKVVNAAIHELSRVLNEIKALKMRMLP